MNFRYCIKSMYIFVMVLTLILSSTSVTTMAYDIFSSNLANGQTYVASSSSAPYPVTGAFDGNLSTRWEAATGVTSNISIDVNFNQMKTIDSVRFWENGQNITSYKIQALVAGTWTDLYVGDEMGSDRILTFDTVTTDKLRLLILSSKAVPGINEFEALSRQKGLPANNFRVTCYLPKVGFVENKVKAETFDHITDVILFGMFAVNGTTGTITPQPDTEGYLQTLITAIGNRPINVWLNIFPPVAQAPTIFGDSTLRQNFMNSGLELLNKYNFKGLDIDYEYPANADQWNIYSNFLVDFKAVLSANNKKLSVAITAGASLSNAAKNAVDEVNVMAYDAFNSSGYHAPYKVIADNLSTLDSKGYDRKKINMGLPLYGRPTDRSGAWFLYSKLFDNLGSQMTRFTNILYNVPLSIANTGAGPGYKNVYFNGPAMIADKTTYCMSKDLGGVMLWHLTQDTDISSPVSLVRSISDSINKVKYVPENVQTQFIEAESGIVGGGAVVGNPSNASGGSIVGAMHINGAFNEIQGVDGGINGGVYTLKIRYATNDTSVQKALCVNGVHISNIYFPSTGGWNTFGEVTTTIRLNQGTNNTIMIKNVPYTWQGVALDCYTLIK